MRLLHLEISQLRNLQHVRLDTDTSYNIFYGNNGSGKTSLLEGIYLLALGRSFRTHQTKKLIHYDSDKVTVFAKTQPLGHERTSSLGISRDRSGGCERQVAQQPVKSNAALAKALPVQLINTQAHFSLANAPKFRRQLMDWGMFHVEHAFFSIWQTYHRALKQRNALLRAQVACSDAQMAIWNQSLSESGTQLSQYRAQYIDAFSPILSALWQSLMPGTEIEMRHGQGWSAQETLADALVRRHADDLRLGHTAWGPHRADLQFFVNGKPAFDALSQGQQKLLLYALRLGQGQLLYQQSQKRCIYLIDDLPAELDTQKRQLIGETLDQLKAQVFITGIEKQDLASFTQKPQRQLFHVEQGRIQMVD